MSKQHVSLALCTALLVASMSVAAAVASAPEQGLAPVGGNEPAAGRVIFQLTAESFAGSHFSTDLGSVGRTGIAGLDTRLNELGATEILPAFDPSRARPGWSAAGLDRIFIAYFNSGAAPVDAAALLALSSAVEFAEPDGRWHAQYVPNDNLYPNQWAHDNTGQAINYNGNPVGTPDCDTDTDLAWDLETGDPNLIVAIIDTGCDLNHPEFSGRIVQGYDFVNSDWDPSDDGNHGTACAGIALAAGDNGQGVAGVAWNVGLMPIKVLDSNGSGYWTDVADGIIFGADNGARVLSLSLGGGSSSTVHSAVDYAYGEGCALFCATGNDNDNSISYPAAYSNAIAVGAMSPCCERKNPSSCDGEYWWGSNYGTGIDFVAPGTRIHTTDRLGSPGYTGGDYMSTFNGTSSATPHAAGIGALVWSQEPTLTNAELWTILQDTCDDIEAAGYDQETGYGRLNAYEAVLSVSSGPPTGACCFADGHCEIQILADCTSAGGTWEGPSTDCSPNPCPQPEGACCYDDGSCLYLTEAICTQGGGTWQGMDTNCFPNPCELPPAACCFPDGTCQFISEDACTNGGGSWQGEGTDCSPNPCPQPPGACCFDNGACYYTTEATCDGAAGNWLGYGTDCDPNPCPQPEGACCFADGSCQFLDEADCNNAGGTWQGDGTDCDPNPCPQPEGACCFPDGACTYVTDADCTQGGGTWQGFGTDCDPNPCQQPSAACCFPNGSCTFVTESSCSQGGGTWQGFGTDCDPNPCQQPSGACCYEDGHCEFVLEADCPTGMWTMYQTCEPNLCAQPEAPCCFGDETCQMLTEVDCELAGGTWETEEVSCDPNPCIISGLEDGPLPTTYVFYRGAPNPFRANTIIRYDLPELVSVDIRVYDLSGHAVRTLSKNLRQGPGRYQVTWDGNDELGQPVGSGVYFIGFEVGKKRNSRSVILLR